jgi:DNA-binding SARP family transcriptional activator
MTATNPTPVGRLGRLVRGLAALAVLLGLVAGVPAGLWVFVGWPLPHALPDLAELGRALTGAAIDDQVLINIIALGCWTVWGVFTAAVAAETVAAVRGRSARRVPLAGPLQTVAGSLVAVVLLTLLPLASRIPSSAPPLAAVLTVGEATRQLHPPADPSPVTAGTQPPTDRGPPRSGAPPGPRRYVVKPHDTLWGIADRELGDPLKWRDIYRLNNGKPQPDGRALSDTDPRHIRIWPGWILDLPPGTPRSSAPPAGQQSSVPHPARQGPPSPPTQPEQSPARSPSTVPSATPSSTSTADDHADDGHPAPSPPIRPAVELPSGAVVGLSLAAAITLALAAARLHRRRRRLLGEPRPGISHSDPLVSPTVRRLLRAVHATTRTDGDDRSSGHVAGQAEAGPLRSGAASDPGVVAIGQRGGREVCFDLSKGGLALTGPTAVDAARSIVLSLLARTQLQSDTAEVRVLLVGDPLAERLFGHPVEIPGLSVVADLDTALSTLEVEQAHRLRLLQDHDAADVAGYLHADPAEPLPTLVLAVDLNRDGRGWEQRLAAVLQVGHRLAIGALLLGPAAQVAPTLVLGTDATIRAVQPDGSLPDLAGTLAFTLGPDDTAELLPVLGAALGARPSRHEAPEPPHADPPVAVPEAEVAPTSQVAADRRPIRVRCLGPLRIELDGAEVRTGLRTKARELLAFLLLHPGGVGREVAIEALWPEMDPARGAERAKDALKSLRQALRAATGQAGATVIELVSDRWHVNPDLVDCDVWHFQAALAAAAAATDDQAKLDALTRAATVYAGTLLQDAGYEWVEEPREELRRQAADVAGRLAELRERAGDLDGALAALQDGASWDAYNEELYQRIMRLQARMGRLDAVRRTYTRLRDRLAELGVDPDETTERLLQQLRRGGARVADRVERSSGPQPPRGGNPQVRD